MRLVGQFCHPPTTIIFQIISYCLFNSSNKTSHSRSLLRVWSAQPASPQPRCLQQAVLQRFRPSPPAWAGVWLRPWGHRDQPWSRTNESCPWGAQQLILLLLGLLLYLFFFFFYYYFINHQTNHSYSRRTWRRALTRPPCRPLPTTKSRMFEALTLSLRPSPLPSSSSSKEARYAVSLLLILVMVLIRMLHRHRLSRMLLFHGPGSVYASRPQLSWPLPWRVCQSAQEPHTANRCVCGFWM